jgi:hypothetical protein
MALNILQQPLDHTYGGQFVRIPAGQQLIFSVADTNIVANNYNVKYLVEVYVSTSTDPTILTPETRVGTFKTTPNNAGSGVFDLRPILETFCTPDHESSFGGTSYKLDNKFTPPIHLIDRFSMSSNSMKYFAVKFYSEYSITPTGALLQSNVINATAIWAIFNGVIYQNNPLTLDSGNYGYDMTRFTFFNSNALQFLSNAPTTQYARATDYGTFPMLNWTGTTISTGSDNIDRIDLGFYNDSGTLIATYANLNVPTTGGTGNTVFAPGGQLLYYGAFPANLRQHNASLETLFAGGSISYYTVQVKNTSAEESLIYTINIICPNSKNYEGIRLTWLNQWGTWDYYTFNMKSTRTVSTKRIPYNQEGGTWNKSIFEIKGWKGGKKNFRVNSTEKIKLNTDFVTEEEGVWFEELINSTEVYIVNEFDGTETTPFDTITNKYIEPVTVTTSNYTRKTIANDKLMQYTFDIEKSKMQRTQSV